MSEGESGGGRVALGAEIWAGIAALGLVPYLWCLADEGLLHHETDFFSGIFSYASAGLATPALLVIALILFALSWKRRSRNSRILALACVAMVLLVDGLVLFGYPLRMQGALG